VDRSGSLARWAVALAALAVASSVAFADVIRLKSGGRIEGTIVGRANGRLRIRTSLGISAVNESEVLAIESTQVPLEEYQRRFAQLKPGDADGHFKLAQYCIQHGLSDEAVAGLRLALASRPGFAQAQTALARLLDPSASVALRQADRRRNAGDLAGARTLWQKVIDAYPESRFANVARDRLATAFVGEGRLRDALKLWQQALRADAQFTPAYLGTAAAAQRKGLWAEAVQLLDNVLGYEKDPDVRRRVAAQRRACSKVIAALDTMRRQPNTPKLLVQLAGLYQQLGLAEKATDTLVAAVDAGVRESDVLRRLAHHFTERLDLDAATRYWTLLSQLPGDAADTEAARTQLSRLDALRLIPRFLGADKPDERQKLLEQIEQAHLPFDQVARMAANGPRFKKGAAGFSRGKTIVGIDAVEVPYALYVPESYRPDVGSPLIVALHPLRTEPEQYLALWRRASDEQGYILLAPGTHGGQWFAGGASIVHSALTDVRRAYHVDTDRVYLVGASLGGEGALLVAPLVPHLFASIAVLAGGVRGKPEVLLPNLRNVPAYIVHGARDQVVPVEVARAVVGRLRQCHTDVMYVEKPGEQHSQFAAEWRNVIDWFRTHPRVTHPRAVTLLTQTPLAGRAYWARAARLSESTYNPAEPLTLDVPPAAAASLTREIREKLAATAVEKKLARVDARIASANRIVITTRNVEKIEVLLSDALVDLDKPVEIQINGEKVFDDKVPRSATFLLRQACRTRDYRMLFANAVRLAVPGM